ncbi:MAG: DUF962 domain-containing protein [Pseudomonadota bacterium]|nr:DUF962 domain-containing protein [Pseudomonadota bacterium]
MKKRFNSFSEFYPFYLSEHQNPTSRRLHFVGTAVVISIIAYALLSQQWLALIALPIIGYGFAWVGHFFFEKNKPATFQHPLYSLMGDFRLFFDILTGKQSL